MYLVCHCCYDLGLSTCGLNFMYHQAESGKHCSSFLQHHLAFLESKLCMCDQTYTPCGEFLVTLLQIFCAITVLTVFILGGVGLLLGWTGGEDCGWCKTVSCHSTRWWNCETARILPEDCGFQIQGNLTASITCPSVSTIRSAL